MDSIENLYITKKFTNLISDISYYMQFCCESSGEQDIIHFMVQSETPISDDTFAMSRGVDFNSDYSLHMFPVLWQSSFT